MGYSSFNDLYFFSILSLSLDSQHKKGILVAPTRSAFLLPGCSMDGVTVLGG